MTPIDVATNVAGTPIPVPGGAIAITPDGQTAYVAGPHEVTPISLATATPGAPIPVRSGPGSRIAITPDGGTAYVASCISGGTVTPISLATNRPGAAVPFGNAHSPCGIAIAPDGGTAYVSVDNAGALASWIAVLALPTNTVTSLIVLKEREPSDLAITPAKRRDTSTSVACAPPSIVLGQTTSCTATVTDTDTGTPATPTGQVWFGTDVHGTPGQHFSSKSCTVSGVDGTASCQVTYIPAKAGATTITAHYFGDGAHMFSSTATDVAVADGQTTTTITCGLASIAIDQSTVCDATVSDTYSGPPVTPTGVVRFHDPGPGAVFTPNPCTLTGSGASASCQVGYTASRLSPRRPAIRMITASYGGDAVHAGSNGQTTVQLTLRSISMTIGCQATVLSIGQSTVCTALVSDTAAGQASVPTGTVAFSGGRSDGFSGSPCTLSGTGSISMCQVTYTPTGAGLPVRTLTARYPGDATHDGATASVRITISAGSRYGSGVASGQRSSLEHLVNDAAERISRLSAPEAFSASAADGIIVDIRSQDARDLHGVIPGSLHIPRTVLEWRVALDSPWRNLHLGGRDQHLILICDHGYSSILAASNLVQLGFYRAGDVIGGFDAWTEHGLPVAPCRRRSADAGALPGSGPPE